MLCWLWFLVLGLGQCQQPGQQQEKDLAVRLGGFGDYLVLEDGGTIASPSSFTLELWHRPERKDRDDYEELCLVSKGSWEGSFKISVLPWGVLRFTVRNRAGAVTDCDGVTRIRTERWYHIAVAYDAQGSADIIINGRLEPTSCNPAVHRYSGGFRGPLGQSPQPLVVGNCYFRDDGINFARGTFADLRFWTYARNLREVRAELLATMGGSLSDDHMDEDRVAGYSSLRRLFVGPDTHSGRVILTPELRGGGGTTEWPVAFRGEPKWAETRQGDQILSLTLEVAQLKSTTLSTTSAGSAAENVCNGAASSDAYCGLTPPGKAANGALAESLGRYFQVKEDELRTWNDLGELRERLETMGHALAHHFTRQPNLRNIGNQSHLPGEGHANAADSVAATETEMLRIAMIVPATGKGVSRTDDAGLKSLPVYTALLRSLYATCDASFRYTVYLAVNEGDKVLNDEGRVTHMFRMAFAAFASGRTGERCGEVKPRLVVLPDAMVPSRSLSALFNIPTLVAFGEGADYM